MKTLLIALVAAVAPILAGGQVQAQTPDSRLSAAGESCTRTADCAAPLRCISAICQTPGKKSLAGESCTATSDCAAPLKCTAGVCRGAAPLLRNEGVIPLTEPSPPTGAYVGLGVGGAFLATGIGLLAGGAVVGAEFRDKLAVVQCTAEPPACPSFNERVSIAADAAALEDQSDALYIAGGVLTTLGLAGVIVGAVLLSKRADEPPVAQVTPWIDARGDRSTLGASAVITF